MTLSCPQETGVVKNIFLKRKAISSLSQELRSVLFSSAPDSLEQKLLIETLKSEWLWFENCISRSEKTSDVKDKSYTLHRIK